MLINKNRYLNLYDGQKKGEELLLRGDAHRFYVKIKQAKERNQNIHELREMKEMEQIVQTYQRMSRQELKKIRYRLEKETQGNGMIPVLVSSLPWLLFIFSKQFHSWMAKTGGDYFWMILFLLFTVIIVFSIILHYRERAWAGVHIVILDDLLEDSIQKKNGAS